MLLSELSIIIKKLKEYNALIIEMGLFLCCLKKSKTIDQTQMTDNILLTNSKYISSRNKESYVEITKDDFEYFKVLGRGTFGKVYLVKKKEAKQLLAMKILKKSVIISKNEVKHTQTERQLLEKINHPFIVELFYAFQDEQHLYLVTEFMQGGELFFHLHKERFFTNERMKFYACEIILALGHIHANNFIYRDLKLENILLDKDGHIKLTDFGLSKMLNEYGKSQPKTICGTPEYLAPEILQETGYEKSVDWWSFGILLYEMLTGKSPFKLAKVPSIYEYYVPIDYPNNIVPEAKSLLQQLLKIEPKERLGYGPKGTQNIQNHPFFKGINWNDVLNKKMVPPFCPTIRNEIDLTNFDSLFTNEKLDATIQENDLNLSLEANFANFTFIKDDDAENL